MVTAALHLPLDFERREDVRKLAHRLQSSEQAILYVFRMWMDWAVTGAEWRGWVGQLPASEFADSEEIRKWLDGQELTHIIEDFCGFTGETGALILESVGAGVLVLTKSDGRDGLVLNDFWRFNQHLSPSHKTIQQRGAIAKHAKASAAEIEKTASQQVDILADRGAQFALPLDAKPTTEEVKCCVWAIMLLYRACQKPQLPKAEEYTKNERLMNAALQVVRKYSKQDINAVYEYVIANRDNPRLGKLPDRILERFGEHLGKAKDGVLATA